jgi:hypothetical protein
MHAQATEGATTLVWIDSEEAIIVRWADRATVERVRSDAGGGHARREGHGPLATAGHHGDGGADAADRARREDLRLFVEDVAARLPSVDDVMVVGPGILRGQLERTIRAEDRHHGRHRLVHSAAADRLTEQELVARVRALAGDAAPRVGTTG